MRTHLDQWWGPYLFALAVWWFLAHGSFALQGPPRLSFGLPALPGPALAPTAASVAERMAPQDRSREEILQWVRQWAQ